MRILPNLLCSGVCGLIRSATVSRESTGGNDRAVLDVCVDRCSATYDRVCMQSDLAEYNSYIHKLRYGFESPARLPNQELHEQNLANLLYLTIQL